LAAKKLCERMFRIHGDHRDEALSHISVSHLYNLRKAYGYQRQRRQFETTRSTRSAIAVRRKPDPQGRPGYLRLDTVHQGDLDGIKGVYHINAVDEVTQFQCVFSVERISERFLVPVLAAILDTFPFVIHGFHADNGSEYINHRVATLIQKPHIEFTKSRPRHSNDNALAESKNASVIRKQLGYAHIPGHWAPQLNDFHREHPQSLPQLSPSLPVPRPADRRQGPDQKALPLHRTFEQLDAIALSISDNVAAQQMNEAKRQLFKAIFGQGRKAG
jgi:transposase InsO family protein